MRNSITQKPAAKDNLSSASALGQVSMSQSTKTKKGGSKKGKSAATTTSTVAKEPTKEVISQTPIAVSHVPQYQNT